MWRRYWGGDGGRLSAAVLRIAIAAAVWWSLQLLRGGWPANAPPFTGVYHPIGVWTLLGDQPPSQTTIDVLWAIARVSTLAMLLGAFSRTATAVSCATTICLASLSYTGSLSWSHQFNPVLLAQLAFLGARGGDTLSIDALVRRRDVAYGYQWSIRLVQFTVALVFASAFFHKLRAGGFTFAWATTDNLRHQLLVRYDVGGGPRPRIVDWLLADAWRYRAAAAICMISQAVPIVACFVRRPVIRAACGAFFIAEVVGIAVVMQWWNPHWLPLAVVFVDWDALFGVAVDAAPPRIPRVVNAFIATLIAVELLTELAPHVRVRAYPFTSFQMFAGVRARAPYDQHLPYGLAAGHFVLDPPEAEASRWLDHAYRTTIDCDPRELPARLSGILADARRYHPSTRSIRLELAILETPAYPAPAHFEPHPIGIIAELRDGVFASELDKPHSEHLLYFRSDRSEPFSVPVGSIAVARIGEQNWVIRMPR